MDEVWEWISVEEQVPFVGGELRSDAVFVRLDMGRHIVAHYEIRGDHAYWAIPYGPDGWTYYAVIGSSWMFPPDARP